MVIRGVCDQLIDCPKYTSAPNQLSTYNYLFCTHSHCHCITIYTPFQYPWCHVGHIEIDYIRMSSSIYRPNGIQPEAGPSKPTARHTNPQLSSEPWFTYPTPPADVVDAELPPYVESENVPMGIMLDRLARNAHGKMSSLVQET
jgi:hypothetical protein